MLKYQLNVNSVKDDLQELEINSFETMEVPFIGDGKMKLTCYLNERGLVREKDIIVVVNDVNVPSSDDGHKATTVKEYTVDEVNDEKLAFSIIYDKYVDLDASFARTETYRQYNTDGTVKDVEYFVIYFSAYHHFNKNEYAYATVYLSDNVTNVTTQLLEMRGEIVDNYTLRFVKDENIEAYKRIFYTDVEVEQNYASMTYFKLLQENYMFRITYPGELDELSEMLNTRFYLEKVMASISLPLTNTFSTELFNSINVDGFVQQQIDMSLNKSAENEKDIYYPISSDFTIPIRRIKFNFHFRQRKKDANPNDRAWAVNKDWSWNGVEISGGEAVLSNKFFSYNKPEDQSDLLSYLDFSDGDVKYRRNVLKKSFARLLFYDSADAFKQRLIAYSTVFFDTGTLLNRYMRNINDDKLGCGYVVCTQNGAAEITIKDGYKGIRTNRELDVTSKIDEDKIEECRLSSQMVVSDKFLSSNSSEGFYLYLWKDDVSEVPIDIYMRVEFNHAKFGRTIPLMMPYDEDSRKIKTFKDIVGNCVVEGGENVGYSLEEYRKYSYIHFKYKKDNKLGYVYYLDPDIYGDNAAVDGDSLILNLYEVNVV